MYQENLLQELKREVQSALKASQKKHIKNKREFQVLLEIPWTPTKADSGGLF